MSTASSLSNEKNYNVEVNIGIADILSLIPEFSGARGEIDFIYFREGCRSALKVLGLDNEDLLLMFLKNKLRGDAYTRFALKIGTYEKLSQFMKDLKDVYAPNCNVPAFWSRKVMELRHRNEPTHKYGALFQELLQCANLGIKRGDDRTSSGGSRSVNRERDRERERQMRAAEEGAVAAAGISTSSHMRKHHSNDKLKTSDYDISSVSSSSGHPYTHKDPSGLIGRSLSNSESEQVEIRRLLNKYDLPQIEYPKSSVSPLPPGQMSNGCLPKSP